MLGKPERTFGKRFPDYWHSISSSESGTLHTKSGLFAYATVYPLQAGQRSSTGSPHSQSASEYEITEREYYWKIVSHVPDETISRTSSDKQTGSHILFVVAYLLLAFGAMAIAYFRLSRKLVREKLKQDEAHLRKITTTMSDGLLVTDGSGKITFANPEACTLLGFASSELIGVDMHGLLHVLGDGTPCPREQCKLLNVAATGNTYRGVEETFKCRNGQLLPIAVSVSAFTIEQGDAGLVIAFHDITERKKHQRELELQAQIDTLTGLNNRRHFYELAELEIERSRRYSKPLTVLMLDVDHFKSINDTHGHHIGDAVLQKLSEICKKTMREIDIIGRLGGEEFAILLPEARVGEAQEVAERLRATAAAIVVPIRQGSTVSFTVSIGVAGLGYSDYDIAAMLKRADAAMYEAKKTGRNRVYVAG